jgi:DNA-binding NarL/FixJ family response regulator
MVPDAIRHLLAEQDDMDLVGDCRGPMHILQEAGRTKADAVILAQEGTDEPGLCSQLLSVYPDLTIVGVTSDLASAFTQQLCLSRRTIISTPPEEIIGALRVAVREPCSRNNG